MFKKINLFIKIKNWKLKHSFNQKNNNKDWYFQNSYLESIILTNYKKQVSQLQKIKFISNISIKI